MTNASQKRRFERTWGILAKAVMESSFEDLNPQTENWHLNKEKIKADARRFFESRRFRVWAEAAGLNRSDVVEAYVDLLDGKGKV